MERRVSVLDRIASLIVAMAFLVIGILLMVLGVTFLPVIGIVLGVPVMSLSVHFIKLGAPVRVKDAEHVPFVHLKRDICCPWPRSPDEGFGQTDS